MFPSFLRPYVLFLWCCLCVGPLAADTYPRQSALDVEHYRFALTLSDANDEITGVATISVRFREAGVTQVRLDLTQPHDGKGMTVTAVTVDGKAADYAHRKDVLQITLPASVPAGEGADLEIQYHGIPATGLIIGPNRYGDRTFFSDNWPNKARQWLPCVDHPYDKATSEFIITAPDHYQVVSNGLQLEETNLPDGLKRTHWQQSVPMATWLNALGVAPFAVQRVGTFDGKELQSWVFPQDRDEGFENLSTPTYQTLSFFSDYVGPFVYEKLAHVQANSITGGAMESTTSIFYNPDLIKGRSSDRLHNVMVHEMAHQWFGNAVTEADWDDVWLSEGFATYFTLLFREYANGHDDLIEGLKESRDQVFELDEKEPEYRIVHDNLDDMSQILSRLIYQKGAWFLHMLRLKLGDAAFQAGIRQYYQTYVNRNASTADFRHAMEQASGQSLEPFFQQWLYQRGNLFLEGSWAYDAAKKQVWVTLTPPKKKGPVYHMPLEVGFYQNGATVPTVQEIQWEGQKATFTFPMETRPDRVELDPRTRLLAKWTLVEGK
ncbi:Peptidase family M1 [Catalinimonas alkaloidigena]|uniref:Aminopeptidase N n=1 Tax=Catalinimonas alkaloidigena TaxID=1075417 RepID=A0A1G9MRZ0_9BACT|nr:M1 family metallopeptidase [Catalinimonas alkaloidigena]SDL77062.1 Peptidase family M1 [Catalinimonas alkaloidigena]